MFHVSQLKLCKGIVDKLAVLPMCDNEGLLSMFPLKITDKRLGKVNKKVMAYVLVSGQMAVKKRQPGSCTQSCSRSTSI
ncbi:hypothetical protein Tco_1148905 [Tanacetum coccineum]